MGFDFRDKNRRPALLALTILVGLTLTLLLILSISTPGDVVPAGPESAASNGQIPASTPAEPAFIPPSPSPIADAQQSASPSQPAGDLIQNSHTNLDAIVALINGEAITEEDFARVQAVDAAMSALFALPLGGDQERLEQMINTALVMQQPQAADFTVDEAEAQAVAAQLLQRYGRTEAELNQALAARGATYADLIDYLQRTLTADGFLAAQTDGSRTALVALQQAARISLGTGVTLLTAQPTPLPDPTVPPAPTATTDSPQDPAPTGAAQPTIPPTQEPPPPATPTLLRGLAVGNLLPTFALPLLESGELLQADDLIGQPTVLSFFTTWCPYCRQQTPLLVEAAERYQAQGIQFIGIDVREEAGVVSQYVTTYGIPFPVVMDQAGEAAAAYAVRGYPTTYFLDSQGRIHARHIGALRAEPLENYLNDLLTVTQP